MNDKDQLLALHRKAIEAHLQNDIEMLLKDDAEDFIMSGRGAVSWPSKGEIRQRLGPYLKATTFDVYRDEIEPVVKVSKDGTLGWVVCQVYVRGEQDIGGGEIANIEFDSSWIELYEKRNGRWLRVGNISNVAPR
ncbi:MAG: hypothetical protein GWO38_20085 [Phycisphaerae bacterium]|nr:hypothetical protein [Phycisphaerae bacterium]NIP53927.1 hypothetical protein [Phycisphaerae bacterium]NIX29866.1 hypothetical protein [Phycisphaerae bacterium]